MWGGAVGRAKRLVRAGRPAEAWTLLPRLSFADALRLAALLDSVGWSVPGDLRDRVLPAARLAPALLAPLLSGRPLSVASIAGIRSVSSLCFAPDAPILAVGMYGGGIDLWRLRGPERAAHYASPDPDAGPFAPAPPAVLRTAPGPMSVDDVVCLPGGRVLGVVGRSGGPFRDLLIAGDGALRHLARLPEEVKALLRLPDGAVAAVTVRGQVWVHSVEGAVYRGAALDLREQDAPLWGAVVSQDGQLVATWSNRSAAVFGRASGHRLTGTGPLAPLSGGESMTFRPSSLLPEFAFTMPAGRIASLDFDPDGSALIAGTVDGAARLLGLDFDRRGELRPHRDYPVVVSSRAGHIAVTVKRGVARVYRWPAREPAVELSLGTDPPGGGIALSPVGWLLAGGAEQPGRDGASQAVQVWDLTPLVLAPLVHGPLGGAKKADLDIAREAARAARVYAAGDAVEQALDALAALLEHVTAQSA